MDRARLKTIVAEEIRRALVELAAERTYAASVEARRKAGALPPSPGSAAPPVGPGPAPDAPVPPRPALGDGLLLLTGSRPPCPRATAAVALLAAEGRVRAIPSFTFSRGPLRRDAAALAGFAALDGADDEARIEEAVAAAGWLVALDLSPNSLNKTILGIEDSIPTLALHRAFAASKPVALLESGLGATLPGFSRIDLLRKLSPRGGFATTPGRLAGDLADRLDPPSQRPYVAPPPRPTTLRHPIVTAEDVYEFSRSGRGEAMPIPAGAIVTAEARDDARRRGIRLVDSAE